MPRNAPEAHHETPHVAAGYPDDGLYDHSAGSTLRYVIRGGQAQQSREQTEPGNHRYGNTVANDGAFVHSGDVHGDVHNHWHLHHPDAEALALPPTRVRAAPTPLAHTVSRGTAETIVFTEPQEIHLYEEQQHEQPSTQQCRPYNRARLLRTVSRPRPSGWTFFDSKVISPYDPRSKLKTHQQKRLQGTCGWVSRFDQSLQVRDTARPPLTFYTGPLGCGKSTYAAALVDALAQPRDGHNEHVLHYFVGSRLPRQNTAIAILCALLKQLLIHRQKCTNDLDHNGEDKEYFRLALDGQGRVPANISNLVNCFAISAQQHEQFQILIDGVDDLNRWELSTLLRAIEDIVQPHSQYHATIFCRESLQHERYLQRPEFSTTFSIANDYLHRDVNLYIDSQIDKMHMEQQITADEVLIQGIKSALQSHPRKSFLMVQLWIADMWSLCSGNNQCIRQHLRALSESPDDVYIQCLRRIESAKDHNKRQIVLRVFKWIASSKEPLTVHQARVLASMTRENAPLSESHILDGCVTTYCEGLVVLEPHTKHVTFVHQNVRDFLSNPKVLPEDLSHYRLSDEEDDLWCGELCLTTLKAWRAVVPGISNIYNTSITEHRKEIELHHYLSTNKLLSSVVRATKMGRHYEHMVEKDLRRTSSDTLTGMRQMESYVRRHWLSHSRRVDRESSAWSSFKIICWSNDPSLLPWDPSTKRLELCQRLVKYAIEHDHSALLDLAIKHIRQHESGSFNTIFNGKCPDTDTGYLHVAASLGHGEMLQVLIDTCRCRLDLADDEGSSPAAAAARAHQNRIFHMLIPSTTSFKEGHWTLKDFTGRNKLENLLHICETEGTPDMATYLSGRFCDHKVNPNSSVASLRSGSATSLSRPRHHSDNEILTTIHQGHIDGQPLRSSDSALSRSAYRLQRARQGSSTSGRKQAVALPFHALPSIGSC